MMESWNFDLVRGENEPRVGEEGHDHKDSLAFDI